eukprot:TRINITY_DN20808_c0_g1_i1.p1 TRINITY_DN20808_c0_g1~~TRINITY_DN20808_c0_g1_i1.p1  ORF type:complete len:668 (+),score=284.21 TRINITY_DN20808_c0_g1_i1:59-2062(+)
MPCLRLRAIVAVVAAVAGSAAAWNTGREEASQQRQQLGAEPLRVRDGGGAERHSKTGARRSIVRSEGPSQRQDANPASIVELGAREPKDGKSLLDPSVIDKDATLEDVEQMRQKAEEYIDALKAKARTLAADEAFRHKERQKQAKAHAKAAQEAKARARQMAEAAAQAAEEAAQKAEVADKELNETAVAAADAELEGDAASSSASAPGAGSSSAAAPAGSAMPEGQEPQEIALQSDAKSAEHRAAWLLGVIKKWESGGARSLKELVAGGTSRQSLQQDGAKLEDTADASEQDMMKELKSRLEKIAEERLKANGTSTSAQDVEKAEGGSEAAWQEEMAKRWDARHDPKKQDSSSSSRDSNAGLGDAAAIEAVRGELNAWLNSLQKDAQDSRKKWQVWLETKHRAGTKDDKHDDRSGSSHAVVGLDVEKGSDEQGSSRVAERSSGKHRQRQSVAALKAAAARETEKDAFKKQQERRSQEAAKQAARRKEEKDVFDKANRQKLERAKAEKATRDEAARKSKERQLQKASEAKKAQDKAEAQRKAHSDKKTKHALEEVDEQVETEGEQAEAEFADEEAEAREAEEMERSTLQDIDHEDNAEAEATAGEEREAESEEAPRSGSGSSGRSSASEGGDEEAAPPAAAEQPEDEQLPQDDMDSGDALSADDKALR